jgi:hypothetical protein
MTKSDSKQLKFAINKNYNILDIYIYSIQQVLLNKF